MGGLQDLCRLPVPRYVSSIQDSAANADSRLLAQQTGLFGLLCHVCEVFSILPSLETNQFSFSAGHVFKKHTLEILKKKKKKRSKCSNPEMQGRSEPAAVSPAGHQWNSISQIGLEGGCGPVSSSWFQRHPHLSFPVCNSTAANDSIHLVGLLRYHLYLSFKTGLNILFDSEHPSS